MEGSDGAGSEVGVEVNTEEEDKLWRVLTGSLQDLPPLSSKIVRIFTSSTFTGTTHLTTHLSTYLIINLTTHLTTDLCCISLSVYLSISFSFLTLSISPNFSVSCFMTDGVSLTLLAYIFYLLVEPFFSTIFFRVFVSHKLLMVLYICLLIFRTCLMISLTVVKILVVYPRLMLGREGGRLYDCQV